MNKQLPDAGQLERLLRALEANPFATLALILLVSGVGFCIWAYKHSP